MNNNNDGSIRLGKHFITSEGYEIVIIKYNRNNDLWIEFQDEYKTIKNVEYRSCVNGQVKNPYHPSIYGVGYFGVGDYKSRENGKKTKEYAEWYDMIKRGYDEEFKNKRPTYKDVIIDEYFHNFQNYCKWREQNYYEIEGERMHLDKDILCKDNKIYSPDKCIFVPERINSLFIRSDAIRGDCPVGVCYSKRDDKYVAQCSIKPKEGTRISKYLGSYETTEQAFQAYKTFKEQYIKEVADEYKNKIPQRLYDAMYNWVIEIDD